jgi:hypothetical protein
VVKRVTLDSQGRNRVVERPKRVRYGTWQNYTGTQSSSQFFEKRTFLGAISYSVYWTVCRISGHSRFKGEIVITYTFLSHSANRADGNFKTQRGKTP